MVSFWMEMDSKGVGFMSQCTNLLRCNRPDLFFDDDYFRRTHSPGTSTAAYLYMITGFIIRKESDPMDTCVCCGNYVPEGRQVCYDCERNAETPLITVNKGKRVGKNLIGDEFITPKRSFVFISRFLSRFIRAPRARSRHFGWLYE